MCLGTLIPGKHLISTLTNTQLYTQKRGRKKVERNGKPRSFSTEKKKKNQEKDKICGGTEEIK